MTRRVLVLSDDGQSAADPTLPKHRVVTGLGQIFGAVSGTLITVGVYQTLLAEQSSWRTKLFCVPNPALSRTEAIAAFVTWAKASPAVLSEGAPDAILRYVSQRFPCATQ